MKKPVVIFLVNSGDFSGAESVNLKIILNLRDRYQFYWASAHGAVDVYLKENQVEHLPISKISVKEIKRLEKMHHPALFHATDYNASVMCALSGIKTPYLSHLHNNPPWIKSWNGYSAAYLLGGLRACQVLIVSSAIAREAVFSRFLKSKLKNIGNPVCRHDVLKQAEESEKCYDICFSGRLVEQKNPLLLLELIRELKRKRKTVTAVIIGDGALREQVQQQIQKDGLEQNVVLVGFQKNPYRYMARSRVFCLPSRYEGYGLVAFEALTLGLPCVAAKVGGLPGIVDETCGFLCREKEEYLQGLEQLLEDPKLYGTYAENAKKRAEKLENTEQYMKQMDECYKKAISGERE